MKTARQHNWGLNVLATLSLLIIGLLPNAQAQTVPVTGTVQETIQAEADVSSLVERFDHQQAQIDGLRSDVDTLLDATPTHNPEPPTTSESVLWLNVSHYRFTPVIEYDEEQDEYIVIDKRFVDLMSKWSGIRYLDWTGQLNRSVNWT
ncbi:MAG: hypothetical protein Kow00105_19170 [Phycisphaeraceae bacterium]